MSTLVTEAIVLHAFNYLESSRIIRLMTREAGIQSVLARGARGSRKRFGSALDLFAQGTAEIHLRPNRDLQTLASLDATRARPQLAHDVGRFTAASMVSEMVLRSSGDESAPGFFHSVESALDGIASAAADATVAAGLRGAWHMIATLGFSPAIDVCANCHSSLDPSVSVSFSHSAGGALCPRCATLASGNRLLPVSARNALRHWLDDSDAEPLDAPGGRAHQRLLREFYHEHVGSGRELPAFSIWESGDWSAA